MPFRDLEWGASVQRAVNASRARECSFGNVSRTSQGLVSELFGASATIDVIVASALPSMGQDGHDFGNFSKGLKLPVGCQSPQLNSIGVIHVQQTDGRDANRRYSLNSSIYRCEVVGP